MNICNEIQTAVLMSKALRVIIIISSFKIIYLLSLINILEKREWQETVFWKPCYNECEYKIF